MSNLLDIFSKKDGQIANKYMINVQHLQIPWKLKLKLHCDFILHQAKWISLRNQKLAKVGKNAAVKHPKTLVVRMEISQALLMCEWKFLRDEKMVYHMTQEYSSWVYAAKESKSASNGIPASHIYCIIIHITNYISS